MTTEQKKTLIEIAGLCTVAKVMGKGNDAVTNACTEMMEKLEALLAEPDEPVKERVVEHHYYHYDHYPVWYESINVPSWQKWTITCGSCEGGNVCTSGGAGSTTNGSEFNSVCGNAGRKTNIADFGDVSGTIGKTTSSNCCCGTKSTL